MLHPTVVAANDNSLRDVIQWGISEILDTQLS